jgi:hypothetical protein
MRYIDVGSTSRSRYGGKEQTGCSSQAAGTCWAAAAGGKDATGGGARSGRPPADGIPLARGAHRAGDRRVARHEQGRSTGTAGRGRAVAVVRGAARGPREARFYDAAVDAQAGALVDRARVRRAIQRGPRLAAAGAAGLLQPEAGPARLGARCRGHRAVAQAHLAGAKKTPDARDD